MTLNEKLEFLLRRKRIRKTDFADRIGITYRALANYLSGSRIPKQSIFERIAAELDTTVAFLSDNNQNLMLNSEERFIYNASPESTGLNEAVDLLDQTRLLFNSLTLTEEDKQALFTCLTEIYFDAKEKVKKKKQF